MSMLSDFISLIFPAKCSGCQGLLIQSEKAICSSCLIELNEYGAKNSDANINFGRKKIDGFYHLYSLTKNSLIQIIIHNIKYKNDRVSANVLGVELGKNLKEKKYDELIDCIVPVPINKKKLRQRKFNQSEEIAKGVQSVINVPIVNDWLKRKNNLKSQVNSNRFERTINVEQEYFLNKKKTLKNKRLLIIDDIVTTGATIHSCLEAIEKNENQAVYVASLAATKND